LIKNKLFLFYAFFGDYLFFQFLHKFSFFLESSKVENEKSLIGHFSKSLPLHKRE